MDWDTVAKVGISVGIIGGLGLATILTGGSIIAVSGLMGASIGGISGGIQTSLMGGKFVDGATSGVINGAVTSIGVSLGVRFLRTQLAEQ